MQGGFATSPDLQPVGAVLQVCRTYFHAGIRVRYPHTASNAASSLEKTENIYQAVQKVLF